MPSKHNEYTEWLHLIRSDKIIDVSRRNPVASITGFPRTSADITAINPLELQKINLGPYYYHYLVPIHLLKCAGHRSAELIYILRHRSFLK